MLLRQAMDLTGRKAIVTGGSRGLGLQIAEALGEMGAEVLLTARKEEHLASAVLHLQQRGVHASAIAADLGDPGAAGPFATAALERLGHCDILVNNAGATWGAAAEDHSYEAWQKIVNLNLNSVFLLTQAIGKVSMIPRRYGRILMVASIAGLRGHRPGTLKTLAYNTTKGAIVNFTRALCAEWGEYGITVNAVAPGPFPSKMSEGSLEELRRDARTHVPLRRIGDENDLKGAAALFCSDAGKHITGQVLAVDGGASAVA